MADIQWLLVEMPVRLLRIKQIISFNPFLQNFNWSLKQTINQQLNINHSFININTFQSRLLLIHELAGI